MGYKIKGVPGSLVTSLGCALPSFLIILLVAMAFTDIQHNEVVRRVFMGIRPAIVALIAAPVWQMAKSARVTWHNAFIPVGAALLIGVLHVSPVIVIALAIVGGIAYGVWMSKHANPQPLKGACPVLPASVGRCPTLKATRPLALAGRNGLVTCSS